MSATLARLESIVRPLLLKLPPSFIVKRYSAGRQAFLRNFARARPDTYDAPEALHRTLWDINFRGPLCNAAGMFKNGDGYELTARQGAGAYIAGTTTAHPRSGNSLAGCRQPFAPYPASGAASNWLGLPNEGHATVAKRLASLQRVNSCPIGASLGADRPGALEDLLAGMQAYERANVDFLEINESCPNTEAGATSFEDMHKRLEYLSKAFLARRRRNLPVIVKFSNDTEAKRIPALLDALITLGYDGVNFGNTSTAYAAVREAITPQERPLFDYFSATFGGGVSGRPLKQQSLDLARGAVAYLTAHPPAREFHVLRTGGIEGPADIEASDRAGVSLNQWYTGYFEAFAKYGHQLYRQLLEDLATANPPQLRE